MTIAVTTSGTIEGSARERHVAFLGIPYAAQPVGALRWCAPQPAPSWSGVRPATDPGFAAPQSSHPIPGFAASGPQDEGCLYLNVFTPAVDSARRPVLFWIHGGGFTHGSATEDLYDGGPLATRGDVVVVTINYRLGALGFLALDELLPGRGLSANCGILDCVAALGWVRGNIEAFGGDPGNVTIFGESAGAAAVGTLLAMPAAKGLFQRAILQSGTGRAGSREHGNRIARTFLQELGIPETEAARILDVPASDIVRAQAAVAAKMGPGSLLFGPIVDGASLPVSPANAVGAGSAAEIPVLIGTNRDEVKLFAAAVRRDDLDDEGLARALSATFPSAAPERLAGAVATYRASREALGLPRTNLDILDAIQSDARFRVPALRLALAQRAHQPNTYAYLFTYPSPARRGALGSCHALEMPFVFGTLRAPTQDRFASSGPAVDALSANMMDAWLSFARSGSPAHEGIGAWPAYTAEARETMVFDLESRLERDPLGDERRMAESLA